MCHWQVYIDILNNNLRGSDIREESGGSLAFLRGAFIPIPFGQVNPC